MKIRMSIDHVTWNMIMEHVWHFLQDDMKPHPSKSGQTKNDAQCSESLLLKKWKKFTLGWVIRLTSYYLITKEKCHQAENGLSFNPKTCETWRWSLHWGMDPSQNNRIQGVFPCNMKKWKHFSTNIFFLWFWWKKISIRFRWS